MSKEKLTRHQKLQIAKDVALRGVGYKDLAAKYNISAAYVGEIVSSHSWTKSTVIPVHMGEKKENYWENEMDYWTGKVTQDNCFASIKYADVYAEEEDQVALIKRLQIPMFNL